VCKVAACVLDNMILIRSSCEVHWAAVGRHQLLFYQR